MPVCLLQFNLVSAGLMGTRGGCLCMALSEAFQAANLSSSDLCLCVMTSSGMSCIAADKYMHRVYNTRNNNTPSVGDTPFVYFRAHESQSLWLPPLHMLNSIGQHLLKKEQNVLCF